MNQPIAINIQRIKEISFFIDERNIIPNSQRAIKLEIGQQLGFDIERNLVELVINVFHFYEESRQHKLSEIYVQNVFQIPNLRIYQVKSNEIKLPGELISIAFQASVGHARALMSSHLLGTPLEFELPVLIDGKEIARHFYPQMFDPQINPPYTYIQ